MTLVFELYNNKNFDIFEFKKYMRIFERIFFSINERSTNYSTSKANL